MLDFLYKPYPAPVSQKANWFMAIGVGAFIAFFLMFYLPFGIDKIPEANREIKLLGYGLVTFVSVLFFNSGLPKLFPNLFDDKNWLVWKEVIFLNAMLICIALGNTWYTNFLINRGEVLCTEDFLPMCFNTLALGIIPTVFLVLLDYQRLQKRYITDSKNIQLAENTLVHHEPISILIEAENTQILLNPDTFLYAESMGNYANIISCESNEINKELHRSTLKHLAEKIPAPNILRCHRSYIINLDQVANVTGNAQGFKLSLKNCEEIIPVSRKYVPLVKAYFAK